jgi:hypothetical protein
MRAEEASKLAYNKNAGDILLEYTIILGAIKEAAQNGHYYLTIPIRYPENKEALSHLGYRLSRSPARDHINICWGPDVKFS